jgi:hypothetical protein
MLPSVTQILSPYSDFSRVNPAILQAACDKGTRVHAACAAHALDFPVDGLLDGDQGYFDSFRVWFDSTVELVISVEELFTEPHYGYCGHPDLVCILQGSDKCVIDLKTPRTTSPSWRLQLAGYAHLTQAQRCFSLRLNPDGGRAIVDEVTDWQRDFAIFLNALSVWKYFNQR